MSLRRFPDLRRLVAMFCMALCFALSAQMAIASIDRLQHVLGIDHAPNAVAGGIVEDDFHHHDGAGHHHSDIDHHQNHNDDTQPSDHGPIAHHHFSNGMLTPWLTPTLFELAAVVTLPTEFSPPATTVSDTFERRRERPPKHALERFA